MRKGKRLGDKWLFSNEKCLSCDHRIADHSLHGRYRCLEDKCECKVAKFEEQPRVYSPFSKAKR